jgi:hypothetical protein
MTEEQPTATARRAGGREPMFSVPILVAAIGTAAAFLELSLVPAVLFGQFVVLLGVLLLVGASAIGITFTYRAALGRPRIASSIVLALLVPAGVVLALGASGQIPLDEVFGLPAPLVIGVTVGLLSTLGLPGWSKLPGAIALVVTLTALAWQPAVDAAERAAAEEREQQASIDEEFRNVMRPLSTDLEDATVRAETVSRDSTVLVVTRDGRDARISTQPAYLQPGYDVGAYACWRITGAPGFFEGTEAVEEFAATCRPTADGGWATTDGLTIARFVDDRFVAVSAETDAASDAARDDVAAVAGSLVEVPEAQLRAWYDEQVANAVE